MGFLLNFIVADRVIFFSSYFHNLISYLLAVIVVDLPVKVSCTFKCQNTLNLLICSIFEMEQEDNDLMVDEYNHISSSLVYSPTCVPGKGANVTELESQLFGCKCSDNAICLHSSLCQSSHLCTQNYSSTRALFDEKWSMAGVVECNTLCTCSVLKCPNRLVQFGPRKNLEIFLCSSMKGYGLKTEEFIPKGAFICEYAGEVIGLDEAKRRFKEAEESGKMNYIFMLHELIDSSENSNVIQTIIDPSFIGNIGRYINHSCDPNSGIVPVRVDSPIPRLGIFAKHDILPGEEITYDYSGGQLSSQIDDSSTSYEKKPCLCGTDVCKGSLPYDVTLK